MINEFRGKYYFLSNFSPSSILYEGLTFLNAEAAFQAQKVESERIKQNFQDLPPNEAKSKGRRVTLRSDWEDKKEQFMFEIVSLKFTQNEDLKAKLLATGNEELIEGNYWHDNSYGNCLCGRCKNIKGKNMLGKILMSVREGLK